MNAQTQREINALIKILQGVSEEAKKQSQTAFKEAAGPLISAIKARAPISEKAHSRYKTTKLSSSIKAPQGSGQIVATYHPGNLQRSFRTLKFRRSPAVFVGPRLDRNTTGVFKGNRADGYYAHFMEFGAPAQNVPASPFVRPAVDAAGPLVLKFAADLLKRDIETYYKKSASRSKLTYGEKYERTKGR
mgnify:FL=1